MLPQPWQQSVCVKHSHVRGGTFEDVGRHGERQRNASGFAAYAEQLMGSASEENKETLGLSRRTA